MNPWECAGWYVVFYRARLSEPFTWFGHCSMYGYNADGTWVFLDPSRERFSVHIAHVYEEVNSLIVQRLDAASHVYFIQNTQRKRTLPPVGLMTCASICAHILGFRASSPRSLRRKLIAHGAVNAMENTNAETEGRPTDGR